MDDIWSLLTTKLLIVRNVGPYICSKLIIKNKISFPLFNFVDELYFYTTTAKPNGRVIVLAVYLYMFQRGSETTKWWINEVSGC